MFVVALTPCLHSMARASDGSKKSKGVQNRVSLEGGRRLSSQVLQVWRSLKASNLNGSEPAASPAGNSRLNPSCGVECSTLVRRFRTGAFKPTLFKLFSLRLLRLLRVVAGEFLAEGLRSTEGPRTMQGEHTGLLQSSVAR